METPEKPQFKVGDVVQLKSGGPLMTILGEWTETWFVGWMDTENHLQTTNLSGDAIAPAVISPFRLDPYPFMGYVPNVPANSYPNLTRVTTPQTSKSILQSVCQADGHSE